MQHLTKGRYEGDHRAKYKGLAKSVLLLSYAVSLNLYVMFSVLKYTRSQRVILIISLLIS